MQSNGNTHLNSLAERIKARTEQDTQEIESLTRKQLENLSRSLSESSKNALSTTESIILKKLSDLETKLSSHCRIMSLAFGKICLQAGLVMLCLLLTMGLFSWAMLALIRGEAQDLRQEIEELKAGKAAWEQNFPPIQQALSGLQLFQDKGRIYLVLPEGRTFLNAGETNRRIYLEIVRK